MKKILIISRTIHPAPFPRSHRATELAKELARQGHDVTLYAVLGDFDYAGFQAQHGLKVRDIGKRRFATLNSDGKERRNIADRVLYKILHGPLEFPDVELMFAVPRIIRAETGADLLISVAIPYPLHWGCALAKSLDKSSFPKVWAADCGDPYMGQKRAPFKKYPYFKHVEKWFCRRADFITVPLAEAKAAYYPEFSDKIRVIPQGFRFDNVRLCRDKPAGGPPTFAYAGGFYPGFRDPTAFLEHLSSLARDFKFVVFTKDADMVKPFLSRLGARIEVRDYIAREQLLYELSRMDFLVNFENANAIQSPSKLIDYALAQSPILTIPHGPLPGATIDDFLKGDYQDRFVVRDLDRYNISNVAAQFVSLLSQK